MIQLNDALRQHIGIFYKDITWAQEVYDNLLNMYPEDYIQEISRFDRCIILKDGTVIKILPAIDNGVRGHRWSKVIIQKGISQEKIREILAKVIYCGLSKSVFYADENINLFTKSEYEYQILQDGALYDEREYIIGEVNLLIER